MCGALQEGAQSLFNPGFIKLKAQLLVVEIIKPGVCQNFGQIDFTEQAQGHRIARRRGGGLAGEAGDQAGGLFTAADGIHFFDKVDAPFAIKGFQ